MIRTEPLNSGRGLAVNASKEDIDLMPKNLLHSIYNLLELPWSKTKRAIDSTPRHSDRRDRNLGGLRHHRITHRNADAEEDKKGNSFLPQITTRQYVIKTHEPDPRHEKWSLAQSDAEH